MEKEIETVVMSEKLNHPLHIKCNISLLEGFDPVLRELTILSNKM